MARRRRLSSVSMTARRTLRKAGALLLGMESPPFPVYADRVGRGGWDVTEKICRGGAAGEVIGITALVTDDTIDP
jgi:hypothetical protein